MTEQQLDNLSLDNYQQLAMGTARDSKSNNELYHLLLGLGEEAGEVQGKAKKVIRDKQSRFTRVDRKEIALEMGDVLWYLSVLAKYFDYDLSEIAMMNYQKLQDRKSRNVLGGSGDHR